VFLGAIPPGHDIVLHPIGFAGWVGCLVTALNLFPIGQLDGGHMMYALFGSRTRKLAPLILAAFLLMGVFFFAGWFLWAVLIAILGLRHPPVQDEPAPLDPRRRLIAYLTLAVFVLSFIPAPVVGTSLLDLLRPVFPALPLP
jgi:Zn-dependent protease